MDRLTRTIAIAMSYLLLIAMVPACQGGGGGHSGSSPAAPTGVAASPGDGEVTVTWSAASGATSYNLYFSSSPGVTEANYSSLPEGMRVVGVTSPHIQSALTNGTIYYFVVTALNGSGEGSESTEVQATPAVGLPTPPAVVAASPGDSEATITWNLVVGATSYSIYRATAPGVTKSNYTSLPGGTLIAGVGSPHLDSLLLNGTTYYYVVTATNVTGESAESMEVSATPVSAATNPVTEDATAVMADSARLNGSFTNPSGFTTTIWFEFGTTPSYGSTTPTEVFAAVGPITVFADLTGLGGGTTHYFRLATQNSGGTFNGGAKNFTTFASRVTLATGLDAAVELQVDATHVYWVEIYGDVVKKVPLNGGLPTVVGTVAMGGNNASLDIDSMDAYWSDYANVWQTPLSGGPVQPILTGRPNIFHIYRYGTDLYWWEEWAIMKVDLTSSATSTIVTGPSLFQGRVAVDTAGVYWTDIFGGTVSTKDHSGGPVVTLAVGLDRPLHLLLDSGVLYWSEDTKIQSMPASRGVPTLLVSGIDPTSLAKDSTHIYWANSRTEIRKVDLSSSLIDMIVVGETDIVDIEVDATSVYWLVGGSTFFPPLGTLEKAPKN
ncbi:MAG: hypothetical protein O7H41_06015 [Planctomycetota bacterium]|nr:hypothetical protein [Planctomycetota bacterium]